jgi:hypothetical protein
MFYVTRALRPKGGTSASGLDGSYEFFHWPESQSSNGLMGIADDSLGIDDKDTASRIPKGPHGAKQTRHCLVRISQQRELEPVLGSKLFVT